MQPSHQQQLPPHGASPALPMAGIPTTYQAYSAYPRPSFPPMPAPFPPPYGYHPSMRPPPYGMYPPTPATAASPYMATPAMMSPPPIQQPWTQPYTAAAVSPTLQPPPPPQTPSYLMNMQHSQHTPSQQHDSHSAIPVPQGGGSTPASLTSLANLAPFLSRPHVLPAPQPIHATCSSCRQRIPMPQLGSGSTSHERVSCPHCSATLVAADVVKAAEEEHFSSVLEPYLSHFDLHNAALAWLSQAKPTRTGKLAVPRAFRWPKATAGKGGYADAFIAMGLVLRRNDTASGHWHCWYVERGTITFQSMQAAIAKRWKENPNYRDGMLTAVDGDDGDDGDDETVAGGGGGAAGGGGATDGAGRKRERDDVFADDSEYAERDFLSHNTSLDDAVDYNAQVLDIRDRSRESVKREKRDSGISNRKGSSTPRSVKAIDNAARSSVGSPGQHPETTTTSVTTTSTSSSIVDHSSLRQEATSDTRSPPMATGALQPGQVVHISSATASPASSPASSVSSVSALSSPLSITSTFSSTALDSVPITMLGSHLSSAPSDSLYASSASSPPTCPYSNLASSPLPSCSASSPQLSYPPLSSDSLSSSSSSSSSSSDSPPSSSSSRLQPSPPVQA